MKKRDTILIVDDMEINRAILRGSFEKEYNLLEAENGEQALVLVGQYHEQLAAVLLDLIMPVLDGYGVLSRLREQGFLAEAPVIVITADNSVDSEVQTFDLGASDIITKPFEPYVVRRRVENLLELYRHKTSQQQLIDRQAARLYEANEAMVEALSSIIEYRSAETGQHIRRIRMLTRVLLEDVAACCPEYGLTGYNIDSICSAAAMHDIGKIAIPDSILNKPGLLTPEEFEVMKTHAVKGSEMLAGLARTGDREYLQYAFNICRYHHERWDGRGYPEGLKGDSIPLCAQVVGVADCYDALTTDRVYKKALPPEQAFQMILNGECGVFSPQLLESFKHVRESFARLAQEYADGGKRSGVRLSPAQVHPRGALEGPDQADMGLQKYFALLRYLGATVMEADLDRGIYHLVYLASKDYESLKAARDFTGAVQSFAQTAVHPEDRHSALALLGPEMQSFFDQGHTRSSCTYRVYARAQRTWRLRRATIIKVDTGVPGQRQVLLIWQDAQDETAPKKSEPKLYSEQTLDRLLGGMQRCRNDKDYTILEMSNGLRSLLGYAKHEIHERFHDHFLELVCPADRAGLLREVRRQLAMGSFLEVEYRVQAKDGQLIWLLEKSQLIVTETGEEVFLCVMMDVTQTKRAQEELRRTLERHRIIMEQANDIIFEWDILADEMTYSSNWQKKFGYDPLTQHAAARVGNTSHIHPKDLPGVLHLIHKTAEGTPYGEGEFRISDAEGHYRWCKARVVTQFNDLGKPIKAVGVVTDVDEERRASQALQDRAEKDELTQVYNKSAGRRRIEQKLERQSETDYGAMLVIDVDDFKGVNDTYGHMFGDAVLQGIAAELRRLFRSEDVVSRIGGDEFLVYMAGANQLQVVTARVEKIIDALHRLFQQNPVPCSLACSVGIAQFPQDGRDYESLFQRGDLALYAAKAKGKNCWAQFDQKTMERPFGMASEGRAAGTRIESDTALVQPEENLVEQAFGLLYKCKDLDEAMNGILELVGTRFQASRVYIFEDDAAGEHCCNTYEWCAPGVLPQIDVLARLSYETLGGRRQYMGLFNENDVFYCPDVEKLPPAARAVMQGQGVISMLQCVIRDGEGTKGYVGFDDCVSRRMWTREQIEALAFVARLLTAFLLKKRAQDEVARAAREMQGLLDHQNALVYVVDPAGWQILYANKKARMRTPAAEQGVCCYEALYGQKARCPDCPAARQLPPEQAVELYSPVLKQWLAVCSSPIRWNGRDCCLLTCVEITR